jgi:enoyl-CoA hydratase/carnithine racemase
MTYEDIRYEVTERVATVTLHRPDRLNAFTHDMGDQVIAAFDEADADDDVRAVVVTGAGRGFCAGADLAASGSTFDRGDGEPERDYGGRVSLRIFASRKPVIGAINGPAVGVGATMTLPMDVRLLSTSARMGFVFARRGIVPEAASSWFLPRLVGISQAMEWVATGRLFDAAEALAGGLARSVHEPDDLLPAAHALAAEIADHTSGVSVALARRMMWTMLGAASPVEAHVLDSKAMAVVGSAADAYEGVQAFLDKRPAVFPLRVSTDTPDLDALPDPSWAASLRSSGSSG